MSETLPPMAIPSTPSTGAFLAIVLAVAIAFVALHRRAWRGASNQNPATLIVALSLTVWMNITAALAHFGVFASLAHSFPLGGYILTANGLAVVLALSPAGRRVAEQVPIAWLVLFQAFRLPLELVLHSWYRQGTLPVQMTYSGLNLDIVTGGAALFTSIVLAADKLSPRGRVAPGGGLQFPRHGIPHQRDEHRGALHALAPAQLPE